MQPYGVLFVCLGNICRSPQAEAIFRALVEREKCSELFEIDSCGTGAWHVGQKAHPDTRQVARENGISLESHRARQLKASDYRDFDMLVAMDESNYQDILSKCGKHQPRIALLRQWDPKADSNLSVPDPYYEGGFQHVFDIIHRSCENLLADLVVMLEAQR